jgi:hypothetical protein
MACFDDVLKTYFKLPLQQKYINDCLNAWANSSALGRRVSANLKSELYIPPIAMVSLLNVFLDFWKTNKRFTFKLIYWNGLEDNFLNVCRTQCQQKGQEVNKTKLPDFLWCARKRIVVKGWLRRKYPENADRILDALEKNALSTLQNRDRYYLVEYLQWSTWNETPNHTPDISPFYFFADSNRLKELLIASLAFPDIFHDQEELWVFSYRKNEIKSLRKPTVADGDASDLFLVNSDSSDSFGRTSFSLFRGKALPELVHDSISFEVIEQVRIAK